VTIVRPFNTYGPRQSARAIVPTVIAQAVAGDVVRVGATSPARDLNFVDDTVAAFVAAAGCEAAIGETLNVATGVETTVARVIEVVGEVAGKALSVLCEEQRIRPGASEVDRLCGDATRLQSLTGWRPEVGFETGVRRTFSWIAEHLDKYRPRDYAV
jgi:nucleoside-diphosphate-sugar epimerase